MTDELPPCEGLIIHADVTAKMDMEEAITPEERARCDNDAIGRFVVDMDGEIVTKDYCASCRDEWSEENIEEGRSYIPEPSGLCTMFDCTWSSDRVVKTPDGELLDYCRKHANYMLGPSKRDGYQIVGGDDRP